MGIAAVQISTGRVIEWQELARPGTCKANAVAAGFDPADVEEREMTLEQALPPPPARPAALTVDGLAAALAKKGVLTAADVEAAKS